ncbi:MAG: chromosomal replication initiator protein DnaA [Phycisphaerae bacterium]|jgi:chromosomal replication initiator protein
MRTQDPLQWNALLEAVRADYPTLYRAWFDSLSPGQLVGGELTVNVPDPHWAHYLRHDCAEAFARVAMSLTGHLITLSFVGPEPETVSPPRRPSSPDTLTQMPLNPDYTFAEFVVGPSNRLAHAACRAICGQPGTLYNPLFIHGASGLGKTHLLQAVCAELQTSQPGVHVLFVSCETFVNCFVRAIETGELQAFRDSVRHADVLMIDDIQFLANRESSQEELFHTFNALYQTRRQIVLSADSPPAEIPTLEDRLVSRFNWGLVAQTDPPNRETRQAILQKKARMRGCEIPGEILDFVAERVESNIRVLEGALTKLITESQLSGKPLTLDLAREVVAGFTTLDQRPLQVSDILQAVSKHFGIRLQELLGRKRTRSVSYPRHIAMYLARKLTPLSLEEIGMHFDGRDHSTILHAERVIESERNHDPQTAETLTALTRHLLARQ